MPLKNRPYIGTWELRNQTLVRHTPDAIVLVNGFREFATCPSCARPLDIQQYITSVSVDASTDPISTANVSLQVPRHATEVFSHDGNYVLQPNLEVIILLRGYFPMKNYAGKGQNDADSEEFNANDVPVYPYYQVFRGVSTEVTHEFSGGFYSATIQCANLLHFWQNLHVSVNGSVFGRRPSNSMVEPHLIGHKFVGANPYSIIYTLVKVGFGAAYGVDFNFSQETNIRATDDDNRKSLYAHAAEWWSKRWTEHSGNLRMYGINGQIYNAFQQAYLGRWFDTRNSSLSDGRNGNAFYQTAKRVYDAFGGGSDYDPTRNEVALQKARELGWDPFSTNASITRDNKGRFVTEDILRMQAFTLDIGKMGSVNLFETEYMSKLEVAEAVKTITGYEFYQDVDGDLVFKPPMYNLDTRSDPVYRIADRDLISISETETEPECTMMKGTGSHFSNITGVGLDGWLGVGGVFIDYRLVAKYGYREDTFETNYMNNRQAIFISAVNRLDLANAGTRSASITIPIRPELRPGYPVYIEHLDCFYYVKSLSHSFSFGGSCTTTINGVAKRSKFLPPMEPVGGGGLPSINQVRLDAPDEYPAQPLYGYPNRMAGDDTVVGDSAAGPPRIYGFPNVVMALDPDKINLDTVDLDRNILTAEGYIQIALTSGFLERGVEPDTFKLRSGNEADQTFTLDQIQQEWNDASSALAAGEQLPALNNTLGQIIQFIDKRLGGVDTPDVKNLVTFLSLQTSLKSSFSPGTTVAGKYRYYSSSHPDPAHQAPPNLFIDQESGDISSTSEGPPDEGYSPQTYVYRDVGDGKGIKRVIEPIRRSVRIATFSNKEVESDTKRGIVPEILTQNVGTGDIRFVTFGPQVTRKQYQVSEIRSGWDNGTNFRLNPKETTNAFASLLGSRALSDASLSVEARFTTEYTRILNTIDSYAEILGVSGVSTVSSKRSRVATVTRGLSYSTGFDASKTAQALYPRKAGDLPMVRTLSLELAQALYSYALDVTNAAIRQLGTNPEAYAEAMGIRADWISAYTDGLARPNDAEPGKTFFFSPEYKETPDWTPIFPISDAGGYEVYGNLPYGRGVDIERYASLIQSSTTGDQTDSAANDAENSVTLVGTTGGANASSLDAIERFFAAYLLKGDPENPLIGPNGERITTSQGIYNASDPADQAAILAFLNTTENNIDAAVELLVNQNQSKNAKIRNSPVTSFFRGQSVFGDTAAANLANLDVDGVVCQCKGVEANFLLEAFSEQYVDRYPEDPLGGYLDETTSAKVDSYQAAKDAMSGRTLDVRNTTLAQDFEAASEQIVSNFNSLNPNSEG